MADVRFDTKKIGAGYDSKENGLSVSPPIYQTTAFDFKDAAHADRLFSYSELGYIYTRVGNPTVTFFAERVKALDGAKNALAVGSGMAAITYTLLNLATHGGTILASPYVYGGTIDSFNRLFPDLGIDVQLTTSVLDPEELDEKLATTPDVKAVYVESLSNPNAYLVDVDAVSEVAHKHGVPVVVDNTIPTPYLYRPFEHGADIVVYSATKGLVGHGNVIAGIIEDNGEFDWATEERYPQFYEKINFIGNKSVSEQFPGAFFTSRILLVYLNFLGAALSPHDAYLGIVGVETLSERLRKQSENALRLAEHLEESPAVEWVRYPGLASSPQHELAGKVLTGGYGGLLSFGIRGTKEQEARFLDAIKVFHYHVNIGDVRSLIVNSPDTTHSELTPEQKKLADIPPNLVRVSTGLEDADDLIEDLDQAFATAGLL